MTTNKNWKPEVYDQKFADNFDLLSRLLISGAREESDDYTVDADTDSVIIETGASKTVTLPTAAAANTEAAAAAHTKTTATRTNSKTAGTTTRYTKATARTYTEAAATTHAETATTGTYTKTA